MTQNTAPADAKVAIFSCANLAAAGIMLRGKRVTGDWQVHRVGCRDLNDLLKATRRFLDMAEYFPSLEAARESFNREMGTESGYGDGTPGSGWDFDRDTEIKPCTKGL